MKYYNTAGLAFMCALLFVFSACVPFNGPAPTATLPIKTPTLTPTIAIARDPIPTPSQTLPAITNTPSPPACLSTPGQIADGVADSTLLAKPMSYHVYLPPCYSEEAARRYPVLYLLHGQTYNEDQWIRLGVPTTMDRLIAASEISPFIIIFPYDYSHLQPGQYPFKEVFIKTLLPQIDAAYRTIPSKRAVGGLSRGGAWALHLGIRHPELFNAIGAHSPAIFYSEAASLPLHLRDLSSEQRPHLFIDIGDADHELKNNRQFKGFLDDHAIFYEWHEYIGFHDEPYWRAHVETYLRWYAAEFEDSVLDISSK